MTAHQLFAAISPALAAQILETVHTADRDLYRVALHTVAQARKVRPVFLERQPREDRHRTMTAALGRPDMNMVAGNVLSGWLVKNQSALLGDFLDGLKIAHEKGVVENLPPSVDDAALQATVDQLLAKHPPEIVALYLHAFFGMNEARWPNLEALLMNDSRVALGGGK
ncbi:MAG: hypothetical protein EXS33_07585 [Pedosphaera sp.]|nr:hypothetical protein [Pedosphaera sp.]